ncbi:MAG: PHP domain-containing protein [Candidatus Sumerlaeota bacterium]
MSPLADLHCISQMSGGTLWPESVADELVQAGVKIGALTDHETLAGQERFLKAMEERGALGVSGVEVLTTWKDRTMSLLCYGFDIHDGLLHTYLNDLVLQRRKKRRTLFGRLSKLYYKTIARTPTRRPLSMEPGEVIDMVRKAGGKCFLSDPMTLSSNVEGLEKPVQELREMGLSGIEAIYGNYSVETCRQLLTFADKHELLVVAGTNFNGSMRMDALRPGIDYPDKYWQPFREALRLPDISLTVK